MATIVYLPVATRHAAAIDHPAEVSGTSPHKPIAGSRVAILDNGWDAMAALVEHLTRRLHAVGVAEVKRVPAFAGRPLPGSTLDEVSREVDYSISALGN